MTDQKRGITIYFMDGKSMKLDFPKQTLNEWGAALKIKEVLGQPHLLAEVEGMLLIFPFANIKYIAAYPAPSQLPETVIKGATVAGG
jgi:hypothetical protein